LCGIVSEEEQAERIPPERQQQNQQLMKTPETTENQPFHPQACQFLSACSSVF